LSDVVVVVKLATTGVVLYQGFIQTGLGEKVLGGPGAVPLVERSNRCQDISIFGFLKMAATAILDFSFFLIFNDRYGQEGQTVSLCQVSSKSLISWPRYGDFSIFPRWRPSAILDL